MALEFPFVFPLKNGMHARPASRFQEVAGAYRANITFINRRSGASANGKSTLSLVATLTHEGDACALVIEGEDEKEAHEGMRRFLTEEFPGCDTELSVPMPPPGLSRSLPRGLRGEELRIESGTPASKGIARAPASVLSRHMSAPPPGGWPAGSVDEELGRVHDAFRALQKKLSAQITSRPAGVEHAILKAHLSIVGDPDYTESVDREIRTRHCAAGEALCVTSDRYGEILASSGSAYLQERVLDIQDVTSQLLTSLYGTAGDSVPASLTRAAICVADTLPPSQFIALDKRHVKGLVLAHGGVTSHTVILARAFGIPCITGIPDIHRTIGESEDLIIDADRGLLIRTPTERATRFYSREIRKHELIDQKRQEFARHPGISADGRKLEIAANAASAEEVELALSHGAEGIGLFRTEVLFMDRSEPPGEEEQYAIYAQVAKDAGKRPVIIRTLDIGGDKPISYLHLPPEENPFLGYRAVRLYGEYPEIINAQLRAILRASAQGNVKIMFPMICSLKEVRQLKARLRTLMGELDAEGTAYNAQVPVGIMVEIPSVAFLVDQLSGEVDFFSIGSNDLTQYFLAADRANTKVSHLYTPFHPSFLRLLKKIIDDAHLHGKWVGLCGEMGGNPIAVPLFLGYGIDEISMAPSLIGAVKETLQRSRVPPCVALLESVIRMEGPEEVEAALKEHARAERGESLVSEELVDLDSEAASKEEAIRQMVDILHIAGRVDDPDLVEEAVWIREETYPTGMGFGVAIPHCKSPHVVVNSIAAVKLAAPVFWKMPDQDPVHFLILIAIAASAKGDQHLKIIAGLARRLMHEEFRLQLVEAARPEAIVRLLSGVIPT